MKIKNYNVGKGNAHLVSYIHEDLSLNNTEGTYRTARPAILVIPGGGYRFCSNRETDPVALKFFASGYETFILEKYSCNEEIEISCPEEEAAEAIQIILSTPTVDNTRIAGIGFSAGAHLLGSIAAHGRKYGKNLNFNAIIMCYPVVTSYEHAHRGSIDRITCNNDEKLEYYSLEKQIPADFPPTFIWSTTTDQTVPIDNSLMLYNAIREKGIKVELHIYAEGNHGLSVATLETGIPSERVSHWFNEALSFLEETMSFSNYLL